VAVGLLTSFVKHCCQPITLEEVTGGVVVLMVQEMTWNEVVEEVENERLTCHLFDKEVVVVVVVEVERVAFAVV
jgi:hypothetical protein